MRILYLGYWGANEGLSQATINPHLKLLADLEPVEQIHYISVERNKKRTDQYILPNHSKLYHHPYYSRLTYRSITKFMDLLLITQKALRLIKKNGIDLIICRSSLAGSIGFLIHKFSKTRFVVESFEPHADYMNELGVWSRFGLSFQIQKWFEKKQVLFASHLFTVSHNYQKFLTNKRKVNASKISVMPCGVDLEKFLFDKVDRRSIRDHLGISKDTIVGIYIGKFGDIYWDQNAFSVFKSSFDHFQKFFLILLTPHSVEFVQKRFDSHKIPKDKSWVGLVAHQDVPMYLSAADFAYSTIRPTPFRKFCCPIKNGEYWANGLPILSPPGIGDDSEIITKENGGVIIDDPNEGLNRILKDLERNYLVVDPRNQNLKIEKIASKYRNFDITKQLYTDILTG